MLLEQFAVLKTIATHLAELTDEDVRLLKPGDPIPIGAEVVGKMPAHVKGLLAVKEKLVRKSVIQDRDLRTKNHRKALPDLVCSVEVELKFIEELFTQELLLSYPQLAGEHFSHGPEFEVYYLPYLLRRRYPPGVFVFLGLD